MIFGTTTAEREQRVRDTAKERSDAAAAFETDKSWTAAAQVVLTRQRHAAAVRHFTRPAYDDVYDDGPLPEPTA